MASSRVVIAVTFASACLAAVVAYFAAEGTIATDDTRIAVLGHVERREDAIRFAWSLSGIELFVTGRRVVATVHATRVTLETSQNTWVDVFVDDRAVAKHELMPGPNEVTIDLDPSRTHRVRIVKRTEASIGNFELRRLDVDGTLERAHAPRRPLIEFVGDSISAGFGIEGANGDCAFSAATENASKAYPALVTEALHGRARVYAWSGKGLLRNADPLDVEPLPVVYGRAIPTEPATARADAREPANMVVVNLGTNDVLEGTPPRHAFQSALLALLDRIRAGQPSAQVLVVISPMVWDDESRRDRSYLRDVIAETVRVRIENGDRRVAMLELWSDPREGVGCQMHPSEAGHARFAREIAAALKRDE